MGCRFTLVTAILSISAAQIPRGSEMKLTPDQKPMRANLERKVELDTSSTMNISKNGLCYRFYCCNATEMTLLYLANAWGRKEEEGQTSRGQASGQI